MATSLTPEEIDALEPTFLGPTWQRNPDGSWLLPERTLGWEVIGWCAKYLKGEDGKAWRFTAEQARFVLWWYAVDEHGEFLYRTGTLQRCKGWGKDPLLAVISLVEFVGPSRFKCWNALTGEPEARAHPQAWVQITAVNQEQTTNTMGYLPILMSDLLIQTYGIKLGAELIRADRGRKRLQAVTSSFRAIEGKRTTFSLLNETHHWVAGVNGHKMYETIDGNATKMSSRYLAITNAYLPGEDSVAERIREAWEKIQEGTAEDVGMLYDSIEAHPATPLTPAALRIVLPKICGDAHWLNIEAIVKSVLNLTIAPERSRRMYLNQITADQDSLYDSALWKAIEKPDAVLRPGDEIVLGFDGGFRDDATALIAIRIRDRVAFRLGLWEKPEDERGKRVRKEDSERVRWEVNREAVNSAVHDAFRLFKVRAFGADVYLWETYVHAWTEKWGDKLDVKARPGHAIAWDMRGRVKETTHAHERLMRAVFDKKVFHDGDAAMRRHALNAFRRVNDYGVSFGKQSAESSRKVDLYAALMIAHEMLLNLLERGPKPDQTSRASYFL